MKIKLRLLKPYDLWIVFLVAIIIYSVRVPVLGVPVYQIVYLGYFALFAILGLKRKSNMAQSSSLVTTQVTWGGICLAGVLFLPVTYSREVDLSELVWIFCMSAVPTVICRIVRRGNKLKNIYEAYIFISILVALIGVYEVFSGNIINRTAGSYYYRKNVFGLTSPNTIFFNINDNAVFMTMSLFIAWIGSEKFKHKILMRLIFMLLYGTNIIMVNSRGAILATTAFFMLQLLQIRYWNKHVMRVGGFIIAVTLILPFALESGVLNSIFSDEERFLIWSNTINSMKKSWFFGLGPGNIINMNSLSNTFSVYSPHNFFLEIAANYGIFGGVVSIYWYVKLLKNAKKEIQYNNSNYSIWNALLCFIPLSIVSSSLVGKIWVICFFAILIATLNQEYLIRNQAEEIHYDK